MQVNIIPRGSNMGFSQYLPADLKLYTTEQLDDKVHIYTCTMPYSTCSVAAYHASG